MLRPALFVLLLLAAVGAQQLGHAILVVHARRDLDHLVLIRLVAALVDPGLAPANQNERRKPEQDRAISPAELVPVIALVGTR